MWQADFQTKKYISLDIITTHNIAFNLCRQYNSRLCAIIYVFVLLSVKIVQNAMLEGNWLSRSMSKKNGSNKLGFIRVIRLALMLDLVSKIVFNPRFGQYPKSVLSSWWINQVNKDMSFSDLWLDEARALSNHRSICFSDTYQPCVSHKSDN